MTNHRQISMNSISTRGQNGFAGGQLHKALLFADRAIHKMRLGDFDLRQFAAAFPTRHAVGGIYLPQGPPASLKVTRI